LLAGFKAAHVRQANIQYDQVYRLLAKSVECFASKRQPAAGKIF